MKVYRLFLSDLATRLGWRFAALIALMSLVGLGEGTSVALLLPLLSVIGFAPGSNPGPAVATLERGLALVGAVDAGGILAVIVVVATVQLGLYVLLNWWTARLGRRYQRQRQMELFRAFMRARWTFVSARKSGELTNTIITECERLGQAFNISLAVISTFVVMMIYFGLSLLIAWPVTLGLIGFALVGAIAMLRLYRKSYDAGRAIAPLNAELQSMLSEQFAGVKIVKATASEGRAMARLDPHSNGPTRSLPFCRAWPAGYSNILPWSAFRSHSCLAVRKWVSGSGMSLLSLDCSPGFTRA